MEFNTISVVGLGYIGLPTAAVIASRKKKVIGVDVNQVAVDTINEGRIHIVEPELDMLVHAAVKEGYLRATTVPEPADVFLIAVPTPFKADGGDHHDPDLSYIEAASKSIAPALQKGNLVILESTSPVGTTEKMVEWLAEARPDLTFPITDGECSDIRIAHCPERVLPGNILQELVSNDRVVGGITKLCSALAAGFYSTFVKGECIVTNARTAEMCKLTENSFRDVNIAFANEMSIICDELGVDVWELIKLANRHPRVNILQPGPGVGGHCIAVDPWFIASQAPNSSQLIKTARAVNDGKPSWVVNKVKDLVSDVLLATGKGEHEIRVACLGLSFKPNIDDLRESPAMEVALEISGLFQDKTLVVEPYVDSLPESLKNLGARLVGLSEALKADVIVLLVDHKAIVDTSIEIQPHQRVLDTRGALKKF
ncbi:UDP-N-acetyl-D-mannosaminuronic acid dehydrogenase [Chromohalobacter marismortui]|uniref:UDP-N-acetyl-D-mannosaminuronic acid dehydrogenase n=1 Tax=Chromohalobacter marismortui TaxID=42055 RepID=A0A4R7NVD6_9GAMM|nr:MULTISPECIES: UDP-N-acetyl-D-mannosamine dehydrogenase [Chromohalobacter]MCI0510291.1 UDP-N-acetyl-D-mannosamine dehydrogenase [Chromohalobacter sp.]MCI0593986.1 UDP-N-acetyl-D-mannosamine dehydrogenase [Chromohalobacter sp.]TDU25135.1 UDP-N-acetyl-D-mannosaminuronic acid dehydrogenase [Chromohalobacter marismortui]